MIVPQHSTFTLKDDLAANITAIDMEDIAVGPVPVPGKNYVYIADTGDAVARKPIENPTRFYRLEEPQVTDTVALPDATNVTAQILTFRYAGQGDTDPATDAETLIVDPRSGNCYIGTKELNKVIFYGATPIDWDSSTPVTLPLTVTVNTDGIGGNPDLDEASAGDITHSGDLIAIRNFDKAYAWPRNSGDSFAQAFGNAAVEIPLIGTSGGEPKGEGLGFDADDGYCTTSEYATGLSGPIYQFQRLTPDASLTYDDNGNLLFDVSAHQHHPR